MRGESLAGWVIWVSSPPVAQGWGPRRVPLLRQKCPCRRSCRTPALFQQTVTRCRRHTTKRPGLGLHTEVTRS